MPPRKGLLAPQNTFLDTIATRFDGTHSNFVLGNAQVPPAFPIVYCSDGFCELSGFSRAQIMHKGCACKFLYGNDTDDDKKKKIETALEEKAELKLEIQFYKKNGTPFKCLLDIVPIKNEKREVVLFLASHKEIIESKTRLPVGRTNPTINISNTLSVPGFESSSDEDSKDESNFHPNGLFDSGVPTNYNYGRRRSRAVLYQLSGHYKNTEKSKTKKIQSKLSTNSLLSPPSTNIQPLPEYKTSAAKKSRWVLSHYGVAKTCWDIIVLCATIYVAIVVPFNATFHEDVICNDLQERNMTDNGSEINFTYNNSGYDPNKEEKRFVVVDVIVETIFIVDILLNFRTTFVNKKGEVVSNSKSIAFHYFRGWFLLDLLAALPFDLLYASEVFAMRPDSFTSIHLLKLTRLLRYSQYSVVILTLLMMTFALLAHWMACVWFVIGSVEQPEYKSEVDEMWPGWLNLLAKRMGLLNGRCVPHSEAYITALYYSCTSLTTVGFGNVSANTTSEKIFSVVIMLIGALMHATIFGNVTALVQRMYGARKSQYQTKWRDLKDFTILHSVPKQLKQRMQDYFQTMWSLNHGIDPAEILQDYPEELRGDISLHLHREVLSLPIFETASEGCRKLISVKIKTNFCAPDEFLIHRGDALHNIYYLSNGSMEVLQDNMVVAILGKGDLVGCDISKHLSASSTNVMNPEVIVKSSCDVRALTYCDLKCLNIPGLVEVLRLYPEFRDQFAEDIQHDLTYNLREGYETEENNSEPDVTAGISIVLPSISETAEDTTSSEASSHGNPNHHETKPNNKEISYLTQELKSTLEVLQGMIEKSPKTRTDVAIQTDFPAAMLEEYVVKNRRRILTLLGVHRTSSSRISTDREFEPLNQNSVPNQESGPRCKYDQNPMICINEASLLDSLAPSINQTKRHSTGNATSVSDWKPQNIMSIQSSLSLESDGKLRKTEVTDI